jgi:hypothetical protein
MKTIREELGSPARVIDDGLDALMKNGIRRVQSDVMAKEIDDFDLGAEQRAAVEEELEASRERKLDLKKQIDQLRNMLESSQEAISFSKPHFASAVSCALQILGAEPLKALGPRETGSKFVFPAMDQRQGADPTWASTMDSLREPRPRGKKLWEWRRESPIRPVVFEDPGVVTDEVVQLHLEQRVVQRLLSRFSSQGFIHHDLSRACLAQSADAIPRILLIGRLALFGPGAARLHEELVFITARWIDPALRKEPLTPYARNREDKTLALLDTSLLDPHEGQIPDVIRRQLAESAPNDVQELLPHLEQRAEDYAADAISLLQKRGEVESKAMREILEQQQKHITKTVGDHDRNRQLTLNFTEDETRQLESNRRHWDKRLRALDKELTTEPARIRDQYEVRAKRIEPIGLVYLWPVTR